MHIRQILTIFAVAPSLLLSAPQTAVADKFRNPMAVFAGLDKITGRIIAFEVAINETVQFGSLQLTPKVCFSRPVTEKPNTTSYIEVDEIATNNEYKRLFAGWIFASSPGLNAIEHPVYDVWLTACKGATQSDLIKTKPEEEEVVAAPSNENQLARPLGADGKPQLDPAERAVIDRAAAERRRQQQQNNPNPAASSAGPILPRQAEQPVIRPAPTQRFFPLPRDSGGGIGGVNPGILIDPARNN
jgi:hypothetical protein